MQMRSLLDEMNNLTMLQMDEMNLKPVRTSVQDILRAVCDGIKEIVATRNQKLIFAFDTEPIDVTVDKSKTILAFVNLLNNAIRFSSEGSEIVIGAMEQGNKVVAWVQDNGIGIPQDKLQKIFEEFYQIEPPNTRRYGGLGIGLTIAKGLIEAQGGMIWAESEGLGKGSTFKVTLPRA
jgi:histidine kinase